MSSAVWPVLDATYTVLSRTLRAHHPRDSVILRPNGLSLPVEFDANRYLALHKDVAATGHGHDPVHHYLFFGHKADA